MAQLTPRASPDPRTRAGSARAAAASGPAEGPAAPTGGAARGTPRRLASLLLLAAVYFVTAKLGFLLAIVHASATAVWPPTGIALAGLLLLGYGAWPGVAIGAFVANITTSGSVATCLGVAAGNTLEALVGAYLVRRFANGRAAFERAMDTFRFVLLAGVVSTAISATFGVTSLALGGDARWSNFGPIWLTWWLGDMGGALVVAPVLLLWAGDRSTRWSRGKVVEAAIVLVLLLAVGQGVFGWLVPDVPPAQPLKFLCLPLLAWVAYRFDPRSAATALLLLAAIAVSGTLRSELAARPGELNRSLGLLQIYLAVTAVGTLALAAVVSERSRAEASEHAAFAELREAIAELEAFSHAISHDLRSPIAAVFNYAMLLEQDARGKLDAESVRLIQRMRASAASAGQLLDQLVKFMSAGHPAGETHVVDMTALAREACAEVVVGMEDGATVQFEVQELPPARGIPQLLGRVLHNLLSNAVKFSRGRENRRVVISGRVGEHESVYSVSDNGMGFDPALSEAVFQPFRQPASGRAGAGVGLGLAIAARIVRRHGGRVGAESDGANGARFWFTLPREDDR